MYFVNIVKENLLHVKKINKFHIIFCFFNFFFHSRIDTAQRHIPKCKNIFNRPKPPKGNNADSNITRPPVQSGKKSPTMNKSQSKTSDNIIYVVLLDKERLQFGLQRPKRPRHHVIP